MAVPSVRRIDTKVCRIDTGRAHGWQVHIQRDGEQVTKLFSDPKYGGSDEALEEAKAHRAEMLAAALISLRRARSHFSQPDSSLTACGQ